MRTTYADDVVETFGLTESIPLSMKADAKAFRTVINTLYTNKIQSPIREWLSNAEDSHVAAGKADVPFDVHLPTEVSPVFKVRDYGVGMSHEFVITRFKNLYDSTKDGANREDEELVDPDKQTGSLGLGSKSFFGYTDSCMIETWDGTTKRIYSLHMASGRKPELSPMASFEDSSPTSVALSFAVATDDIPRFREELIRVLTAYDKLPNIYPFSARIEIEEKLAALWSGEILGHKKMNSNVSLELFNDSRNFFIKQGSVVYPISSAIEERISRAFPDFAKMMQYVNSSLMIVVPIGTVSYVPSREFLEETEENYTALIEALREVERTWAFNIYNMVASQPTMEQAFHQLSNMGVFLDTSWIPYHGANNQYVNLYARAGGRHYGGSYRYNSSSGPRKDLMILMIKAVEHWLPEISRGVKALSGLPAKVLKKSVVDSLGKSRKPFSATIESTNFNMQMSYGSVAWELFSRSENRILPQVLRAKYSEVILMDVDIPKYSQLEIVKLYLDRRWVEISAARARSTSDITVEALTKAFVGSATVVWNIPYSTLANGLRKGQKITRFSDIPDLREKKERAKPVVMRMMNPRSSHESITPYTAIPDLTDQLVATYAGAWGQAELYSLMTEFGPKKFSLTNLYGISKRTGRSIFLLTEKRLEASGYKPGQISLSDIHLRTMIDLGEVNLEALRVSENIMVLERITHNLCGAVSRNSIENVFRNRKTQRKIDGFASTEELNSSFLIPIDENSHYFKKLNLANRRNKLKRICAEVNSMAISNRDRYSAKRNQVPVFYSTLADQKDTLVCELVNLEVMFPQLQQQRITYYLNRGKTYLLNETIGLEFNKQELRLETYLDEFASFFSTSRHGLNDGSGFSVKINRATYRFHPKRAGLSKEIQQIVFDHLIEKILRVKSLIEKE